MKIAIITGGTGEIGRAIAASLDIIGYKSVLIYSANDQKALLAKKRVPTAIIMKCDVSNEKDVSVTFEKIRSEFGKIDLLVNNSAPLIKNGRFDKKDLNEFRKHIDVTFFGAVYCCRSAIPLMKEGGLIVNILTEYVHGVPPPGISEYVSAKYALLGLTRCLAAEFFSRNIRVNSLSPSMIETDFLSNLPHKLIELEKEKNVFKSLTKPEDVANKVVYLLSSEGSNLNGMDIEVNINK